MGRRPLFQCLRQGVRRGRCRDRLDIGDKPFIPFGTGYRQYHRFLDIRQPFDLLLNLAQLNAEAPNLDLVVSPSDKFIAAVKPAARQVACAVEPPQPPPNLPLWGGTDPSPKGEVRRGQEAFRRQGWALPIALRHATAADVKLPDHAIGDGVTGVIEQIECHVG